MSGNPVSFGLAAAVTWGAADFTGGLASRRTGVYAVVVWAELSGLLVLFALAGLTGEPAPDLQTWLLAGAAGIGGGFALLLFYQALAAGQMSIAAPISAVLAAAVPVLVSAIWLGLPGPLTGFGMLLALLAITLISRSEGPDQTAAIQLSQIRLPLLAGLGFGLYFILLHLASPEGVIWPLIAARCASVLFLIGFSLLTRQEWLPGKAAWLLIIASGLLDTTANAFYILATQIGRLDVAAVLSSLYPGGTVLLAWLILKERVSRLQMVGVIAALVAIVLITSQ